MATNRTRPTYSIDEYVLFEDHTDAKHEYFEGQILGMGGGTPEHALYAINVSAILHTLLAGGPCRVYSADLRVRVQATGLITYADATVVCGELVRDRDDKNAVVNPALLVEVTSPSTAGYDRGGKLDQYKTISSLREVVFVAHDAQRIDLVTRQPDGTWRTATAGPGETLALALGVAISVDDVYR